MIKMREEDFLQKFHNAISNGYICPYFQGQFNHSTGRMIGAEALMRWIDPECGIQSPIDFIPVLERNDLITEADLYIFECVCKFQRKCIDEEKILVPISINLSRIDICKDYIIDRMEEIRKKFNVSPKFIHIEITESSAIGGMDLMKDTIEQLHQCGYIVEMDDFGSGYSSLNVLKDLPVDRVKLDMRFLNGDNSGREGIIISSIVQMIKWLDSRIIAEGVEEREQADYLKSIGCNYIQGYLYAKPIPEGDFYGLLDITDHEPIDVKNKEVFDSKDLWDPKSKGTIVFNEFMGPAAIFSYNKGNIRILKVNKNYISEIGMNLTEFDIIRSNPLDNHDEESKSIYIDSIEKALKSNEEIRFENWRTIKSKCCGEDSVCIESTIKLLGYNGQEALFLSRIRNITSDIRKYQALADSEKKFRYASEQINEYAWEYTIATHEMRPCFRCMRDLGLPAVLKDYPNSAIEMGIFPPDYADMYRGWHKQMEEGVKSFDAIIPLTAGRVPFHVRYTVECDENGRPLKAYGSAALVVDK